MFTYTQKQTVFTKVLSLHFNNNRPINHQTSKERNLFAKEDHLETQTDSADADKVRIIQERNSKAMSVWSHPPFYQSNILVLSVQIVKLLITMFFTLSRFPSLLFKYYPQRPVLRHSKSYWPTWSERSSPRPIQNR